MLVNLYSFSFVTLHILTTRQTTGFLDFVDYEEKFRSSGGTIAISTKFQLFYALLRNT